MKSDIRYIDPLTIPLRDRFVKAFAMKNQDLKNIEESISSKGWDKDQPVVIASVNGAHFLIDGHSRRQAAINTGTSRITYIVKSFASENEAFEHVRTLQYTRRNLQTEDIVRLILKDETYLEAPNKKKYISETFKVSIPQAGKIMSIMADGRKMAVILKRKDDGTTAATAPRTRQANTSSPVLSAARRITAALDAGELTADELEALAELRAVIGRVLRSRQTA